MLELLGDEETCTNSICVGLCNFGGQPRNMQRPSLINLFGACLDTPKGDVTLLFTV